MNDVFVTKIFFAFIIFFLLITEIIWERVRIKFPDVYSRMGKPCFLSKSRNAKAVPCAIFVAKEHGDFLMGVLAFLLILFRLSFIAFILFVIIAPGALDH